jgi:ketosteroid isomerase-like protein
MRHLALFLLLATPLASQAPIAPARERLLESARAASEAVYANGIAAGLPSHLAADAVLVWPGAAVLRGTPAINRFLAAQRSTTGASISWQTLHLELAPDSSLALSWGIATIDRPASAMLPKSHRIARFLAAWQPVDGAWRISALVFSGLINGAETVWGDSLGMRELPMLRSTGAAGPFIAADSSFAALAGREGAEKAFSSWAATDAVMFGATGELAMGKASIGALFAGDASHWSWGAVAAGASRDGTLGWTVGQAVIAGKGADGKEQLSKSKYLTLWKRQPDGSVRFISDGGNGRP